MGKLSNFTYYLFTVYAAVAILLALASNTNADKVNDDPVTAVLKAWGAGDDEGVKALFTENCVVDTAMDIPNIPNMYKVSQGREGVQEWFDNLKEKFEIRNAQVNDLTIGSTRTYMSATCDVTYKKTRKAAKVDIMSTYIIDNGLISKMTVTYRDPSAVNALAAQDAVATLLKCWGEGDMNCMRAQLSPNVVLDGGSWGWGKTHVPELAKHLKVYNGIDEVMGWLELQPTVLGVDKFEIIDMTTGAQRTYLDHKAEFTVIETGEKFNGHDLLIYTLDKDTGLVSKMETITLDQSHIDKITVV